MYAAERKRQILDIIRRQTSVKVAELARSFQVSESTIRRDLNKLDRANLLERTYGGAVLTLPEDEEASFNERRISHQDEKCRIGQAAVRCVNPGETILIDGGTTTECMIEGLRDLPGLTVVTYAINIIAALSGCKHITVIGIGGVLQHDARFFGGILAIDAMNAYNIRFDKAFIGVSAVSVETGVTNFGLEEVGVKRKAIELARQVILLADSSKIGQSAPGFVAPVTAIHRLITDQAAPEREVERLRAQGITVDLI